LWLAIYVFMLSRLAIGWLGRPFALRKKRSEATSVARIEEIK